MRRPWLYERTLTVRKDEKSRCFAFSRRQSAVAIGTVPATLRKSMQVLPTVT